MSGIHHSVPTQQLESKLQASGDDPTSQNRVFESIASEQWHILMSQRQYQYAADLWKEVLSRTVVWEQNSKNRVHKGTPYYFLAVSCLLGGKSEFGFLYMHRALEEDMRTSGNVAPDTPAWKFVTLDHKDTRQFALPLVQAIAGWLETSLDSYRKSTGHQLTLSEFSDRFLSQTGLRDQVFSFVHQAFEVKELASTKVILDFQSAFGSFRLANHIFALCLVVDGVIDSKVHVGFQFSSKLSTLARRAGLSLDEQSLGQFNGQFKASFGNTVSDLLSAQSLSSRPLSEIERSLVITYGFRNFGAHRIEEQPVVVQNHRAIFQAVLNTLYFAVEKLY